MTLGRRWEGSELTAVTVPAVLVSIVIRKNVPAGCCPPSQPWSVQTVSMGLSFGMTPRFGTVVHSPRLAARVLCSRPPPLPPALLFAWAVLGWKSDSTTAGQGASPVSAAAHGTGRTAARPSRNWPRCQDPRAPPPRGPAELHRIWPHSPVYVSGLGEKDKDGQCAESFTHILSRYL